MAKANQTPAAEATESLLPTIESVQAELAEAKATIFQKASTIDDQAERIDELEERLQEAETSLQGNEALIASMSSTIEELQRKLGKATADKHEFEFEGRRYAAAFKSASLPGGRKITPAEVVESPELQAHLVGSASGLIHEVV